MEKVQEFEFTLIVFIVIIGCALAPAWYIAFSAPHSRASATEDLTPARKGTSSIDYICILLYTSVSSWNNYALADLISFRIDEKEKNCYSEHMNNTVQSVDRIKKDIRKDNFRYFLVGKMILNTASAIALLFASLVFIFYNTEDTSYMYQIALSSLVVSFFASNSLSTHDKYVGRLYVKGDNDRETEHKKFVREEIKIGSGVLDQAITVYTVTVLNVLSVLLGAISMDDTFFQFVTSRMRM